MDSLANTSQSPLCHQLASMPFCHTLSCFQRPLPSESSLRPSDTTAPSPLSSDNRRLDQVREDGVVPPGLMSCDWSTSAPTGQCRHSLYYTFANVCIGQMTCFHNSGSYAEWHGWNLLHSVKSWCYKSYKVMVTHDSRWLSYQREACQLHPQLRSKQ